MPNEFRDVPSFKPWGPFIGENFVQEPITKQNIIVASIVWGLTLVNVIIAIWLIYGQTRGSRSPLRSVYVWMIWLELIVSFVMGLECFLHLLKIIRPSFAFFFTIRKSLNDIVQQYPLTFCSFLVVYSSAAPSADYHQPYPSYRSRSKEVENDYDWYCRVRHHYQRLCLLHLDPRSIADKSHVRTFLTTFRFNLYLARAL